MNKVPTSLQRGLVVYVVFLVATLKLVPHLMRYVMGCISPGVARRPVCGWAA